MKYLITGFPGSGKSTVASRLKKRGYNAYDVDGMHSVKQHINRRTGQAVVMPEGTSFAWGEQHDWVWNIPKIKALIDQSNDVFICDIATNQSELYDQFDKIFVLVIDEEILRDRLATRTTNDYGKHPKELAHAVANYRKFQNKLSKLKSAVVIDATKPADEVVDEIIEIANGK